MIRKDPDPGVRLPGAEPKPEPQIDPVDEELLDQVKCDSPGIIDRVRDDLRARTDRQTVAIDDFTILAAGRRFVENHADVQYLGTQIIRLAKEQIPQGRGHVWVMHDPTKHPKGTSTKIAAKQYLRLPRGESGFPEIYLVTNGKCTCIGHTISVDLLRRMERSGTLGPAGERLLREQGGVPAEELVEQVEEVTVKA